MWVDRQGLVRVAPEPDYCVYRISIGPQAGPDRDRSGLLDRACGITRKPVKVARETDRWAAHEG
jgi:hypothetical protein